MTISYQTARYFNDTWGCSYPYVSEIFMKLANNNLANEDIIDLYHDGYVTEKEARYILHSNNAPKRVLDVIK